MNTLKTVTSPYIPYSVKCITLAFDILALILGHYIAAVLTPPISQLLNRSFDTQLFWSATQNPNNVYMAVCAIIIFLFFNKGHYTTRMPWWSQVQFVLKTMAIAFLVFGFVSFFLKLKYSVFFTLVNFITASAMVILFRYIAIMIKNLIPGWRLPTVMIGDYTTVTDALYAFSADPSTGYDIEAVLFSDVAAEIVTLDNLPARYRAISIKGKGHTYLDFMKDHKDKFHIVSIESFRGENRDYVTKAIYDMGIAHALIPAFSRMNLYETHPQYFFGHDVMLLHTKPSIYSPFERTAKRMMDITLASMGAIIAIPILALMSISIKLEGQGGSLFYGGKRIGKNGKLFKCWKFRTMEPDSDHLLEEYLDSDPKIRAYWNKYRKLDHDPRITTRTAKIIRKASLDEVPQLWNVLIGDMSIVGPRPILEDEVEQYGDIIEEYKQVRPGITGLWQVSGRNAVSFARRVYWDSWYIRNWSLWSDIVIILKTVKVVLTRHGAS